MRYDTVLMNADWTDAKYEWIVDEAIGWLHAALSSDISGKLGSRLSYESLHQTK